MNPISMIRAIDSVWETPFSDEVWEFLREKQTENNDTEELEVPMFGPVLPDDVDHRIATLTVGRRRENGKTPTSRGLRWNLGIMHAPKMPPPEKVKAADKQLGGRQGLQKLIEQCITGIPPITMFRLLLRIPVKEYICKVIPRAVDTLGDHDIAAGLARTTRLEQIGYRFENSEYGLEEVAIIYDHEKEIFLVNSRASRVLRIGTSTWCPYADDVAELLVKAFFASAIKGGA